MKKVLQNENEAISKKISRLERRFRHRINNTHIFVQKAIPLLELHKQELERASVKENRRYTVPSIGTRIELVEIGM